MTGRRDIEDFRRLRDLYKQQTQELEDSYRKEEEALAKDCVSLLREVVPESKLKLSTYARQQLALKLYQRQQGICPYCGGDLIDPADQEAWSRMPCHIDHIIPFARGGGNEEENLQLLHPGCNQKKGDSVELNDQADYLLRRCDDLES